MPSGNSKIKAFQQQKNTGKRVAEAADGNFRQSIYLKGVAGLKYDETLNSEIREALLKGAEGIQPRTGGFNLIKEILSGNEGSTEIMK